MTHYILRDKTPLRVPLMQWARWFEDADRVVKQEAIETATGQIEVSTVFLGLDHAHFGGPPLLFETMIFGGPLNEHQWRCSTWEQAEAQHEAAVAQVRAAIIPPPRP